MLTSSADGTARIWDAKYGTELVTLEGHTDWVWQATWSRDETRVLTGRADGTARVWYDRMADLIKATCRQARRNMTWDEWNRFMDSRDQAQAGQIDDAIAADDEAKEIYPDVGITASDWSTLCWFGSLYQQAAEVEDACAQAVALDPDDGRIRASRGLNRALLGDFEEAVEDFEFAVEQRRAGKPAKPGSKPCKPEKTR